ncbi:MAG TPA: lysylphosphatidylglycerol synthase domain-containing protein, partial [Candidatus Dormibacteraeota bacterium]|nr:lysylphosphatidylglycerol synthase domain-containing protein [Candidatus Dormibacteraeota bacterium]
MLLAAAGARRRILRSVLGTVAGLLFLVLLWRALGRDVSWSGIHLQAAAAILAFVGAAGFLAARAWRYHLLLPRHRPGTGRMLGVTAISWAIGLLVPGPSADASFIALARSRMGVSAARATGVSVVGRVLDVVSLGVVAVVA